MATYTSYLNLEKPTTSETFNLLKMNQNWDKIDAGVSALNSKIDTVKQAHNFGSSTLTVFETTLADFVTTLAAGTVLPIIVEINETSGLFIPTQYIGHVYRITNTRFYAVLYKGFAFDVIVGRYNNGTYEWKRLAVSA